MRRPRIPALRERDFRLLTGASVLNGAGMTGELVVVSWIVLQWTDSEFMVGLTLALFFLPMLLFGLPGGAVADWLDRRLLLRYLDAGLAVILAGIGLLLAFDLLEVWKVLVLTLFSGAFKALYQPSRLSYAYDIVGPGALVSAISMVTLATRLGGFAGPLLAGSLTQRAGPEYAYFALAGMHALAAVVISLSRTRSRVAGQQREPILANLRQYATEMRTNHTLLLLVGLTATVEVFGFSYLTALAPLARDVLNVGSEGLGVLHSSQAVGGILAILWISTQGEVARKGRTYIVLLVLFAGSLMLLGGSRVFPLAVTALVMVAGAAALSDILTQSLMQLSVATHLRGRAMGSWVFAIGAAPFGHLQMGALAGYFGASAALLINGGGLLAITVIAGVFAPRLRRL